MKVLDSKFVKDFIKMADDGYREGWHERNGGNLSYRIRPEEVETIRSRLSDAANGRQLAYRIHGGGIFPGERIFRKIFP